MVIKGFFIILFLFFCLLPSVVLSQSTLAGDLNNDGTVNIFDYNILLGDFGKTGSAGFVPADINRDGKIDIFDFNVIVQNFGKNGPTPTSYPIIKDPVNMIYTTPSCRVTFKEAPDMDALARTFVQLCQDSYFKMAQKLGNNNVQLPFDIEFSATQTGPGATLGSHIVLGYNYFIQYPDDLGVVIHEMAHVIQAYPSGSSFWLTEGIADYIRYWMGYQNERSYAHCIAGKNYTSGYWCSAAFLQYVDKTYDRDIVTKLDTALRAGNYNDSLFITYTGKNLSQLWTECLLKDCTGGT